MKEKISYLILNKLANSVENSIDLFIACLNAGYGANLNKINYELNKIKSGNFKNNKEIKESRKKFNRLISKLKKDGLIEKKGYGKDAIFSLSKKGFKKIKKEKNKLLPKINYSKPKGNKIILISFDIPEEKRNKRDWIRRALIYLGFENIHQSVFINKGKIPNGFLEDLENLKLMNYIEIIEVTGSGTLNFSKKGKK